MRQQFQEDVIALAEPALRLATTRLREELVRAGLRCSDVRVVDTETACGTGFLVRLGSGSNDELGAVTIVLAKGESAHVSSPGGREGVALDVPGIVLVQVGGADDEILCQWVSDPVPSRAVAEEFVKRIEALEIAGMAATAVTSIAEHLDTHSPYERPGYAQ